MGNRGTGCFFCRRLKIMRSWLEAGQWHKQHTQVKSTHKYVKCHDVEANHAHSELRTFTHTGWMTADGHLWSWHEQDSVGFNKTGAGVLQRTRGVTLSKTFPGSDRNPTTLISGWKSHGRAKRRKISGAQITL